MKKTTIKDLEKRIEALEKLVNKPSLSESLEDKGIKVAPFVPQPPYNLPTWPNGGEWCRVCGAWKQYGFSDNHHCPGYRITC